MQGEREAGIWKAKRRVPAVRRGSERDRRLRAECDPSSSSRAQAVKPGLRRPQSRGLRRVCALAVVAALAMSFGTGAAAASVRSILDRPRAAGAPSTAPPAAPEFPPGTWQGSALVSGSLNFSYGQVSLLHPAPFSFTVAIGPSGTVSNGTWNFGPIDEVLSGSAGQGMATGSSSGTTSGTAAALTLSGQTQVSGTVTANGTTIPLDVTTPFVGGSLQPTNATCGDVFGDLVFVGGIAKYAFQAHLVGKPSNQQALGTPAGSSGAGHVQLMASEPRRVLAAPQPSLDAEASTLITMMDQLTSQAHPNVLQALSLIPLLNDFYSRVFTPKRCPAGIQANKTALYRKVASSLVKLLAKLLPKSSDYTARQMVDFVRVAGEYGLLPSLVPELYNALKAKLSLAEAANNADDCNTVAFVANGLVAVHHQQTFNFRDIAARADKCA